MKKLSVIFMAFALCFCVVGCKDDEELINNENTGNTENNGVTTNDTWNNNGNFISNPNAGGNADIPYDTEADLDIKHENAMMEIDMFGLYTAVYTLSGEQVVDQCMKYSFYSEAARDDFAQRCKENEDVEVTIDGLNVILRYPSSTFENLTKTQVIDEYEKLKEYYEN